MGDNRRRHERFDVYAQVELARDGEMAVLSVRNLSMGGVFVEAPLGEYPNIKVGSKFELTISLANLGPDATEEPPDVSARCVGRVVRRDRSNPPGFAMVFEQVGAEQVESLKTLIDTAPKR